MTANDTDAAQADVTRTGSEFRRLGQAARDHVSAIRQQLAKIDLSGLDGFAADLDDAVARHEDALGAMNNPEGNAPGDADVPHRDDDDDSKTSKTDSKTAAKSS